MTRALTACGLYRLIAKFKAWRAERHARRFQPPVERVFRCFPQDPGPSGVVISAEWVNQLGREIFDALKDLPPIIPPRRPDLLGPTDPGPTENAPAPRRETS